MWPSTCLITLFDRARNYSTKPGCLPLRFRQPTTPYISRSSVTSQRSRASRPGQIVPNASLTLSHHWSASLETPHTHRHPLQSSSLLASLLCPFISHIPDHTMHLAYKHTVSSWAKRKDSEGPSHTHSRPASRSQGHTDTHSRPVSRNQGRTKAVRRLPASPLSPARTQELPHDNRAGYQHHDIYPSATEDDNHHDERQVAPESTFSPTLAERPLSVEQDTVTNDNRTSAQEVEPRDEHHYATNDLLESSTTE